MRDNEFCDATLASVDGQKFKAHKVILSASSNFITLINTEKAKLERNQVDPFVIFITRIELFRLSERVIEEARLKVKKNSGFWKESQCNYVHTDEDCYVHLQG